MTIEADQTPMRKILWAGNVREHPILARLEPAARHDYVALALSPDDVQKSLADGVSYADLRAASAASGVALEHLDPIATWTSGWEPADDGWAGHGDIHDFLSIGVDEFFAMAEQLEARSLTALGAFPAGAVEEAQLIEDFGRLCDKAAALDMRVDLEFIPFWGIAHLDLAWRIVDGAGAANGAIGFDFWHFSRGNPDTDVLADVPGQKIGWVQVCDASLTPVAPSVVEDCLFHRVQPGEGEFDVTGLLRTLDAKGALGLVGPEIFSSRIDALDAADAVREVDAGFTAALDRALGPDALATPTT